jgi:hypothetical protein
MQKEPPLFLLRQKYHEQVSVFPGNCHGPMDSLLRHFLGHFIRRGSITFTTASGASDS